MRGTLEYPIEFMRGLERDSSPLPRVRKPGSAYIAENCRFGVLAGATEKIGGRSKLASNLFTGVETSEKFTGTGLDDLTPGGTFTGTAITNYRIEIDAAGAPDTFKWSDDGGSSWDATGVAITGAAQTLNNGVTVTFGATTGHTLGDYWDFSAGPRGILGLAEARIGGSDALIGCSSVEIKKMTFSGGVWSTTDISGDWSPACPTDKRWCFTVLNDTLIISDFAENKLKKWSGSGNVADLGVSGSGITTLKARYLATVGNVLFLGYTIEDATEHKSRIRWSDGGTPEQWTSTNYVDVGADDGDIIMGMVSLQNIVVVFKRESIWTGHYVGAPDYYVFEKVVPNKGSIAPFSLISHNNLIYFIGYDGIYVYDGTPQPNLISGVEVSDYLTRGLTEDSAYQIWGERHSLRQELWFSSQDQPNASFPTWIFNLKTGDWSQAGWKHGATSKARHTARETWNSIPASTYTWNSVREPWDQAFNKTGDIIFVGGDASGDVHKLDVGSYDDNGTPFTWKYRTNPIDCGAPDRYKRFFGASLKLQPAAGALKVRVFLDGKQLGSDISKTISSGEANQEYEEIVVYFNGVGRVLQLEFENADAAEAVRLMGITPRFILREHLN